MMSKAVDTKPAVIATKRHKIIITAHGKKGPAIMN